MATTLSRPAVVVVDQEPARRNLVAKFVSGVSRHVEPYESPDELQRHWPCADIILLHDDKRDDAAQSLFELMACSGRWLPVVVYSTSPAPSRIVDVIFMGAMDYIAWPTSHVEFAERMGLLSARGHSVAEIRERRIQSQRLISGLSPREREVLRSLSTGASNKTIARALQLSPRTVEIHRANMMGKLGVTHLGEAVTIAHFAGFLSSSERVDHVTQQSIIGETFLKGN